MCTGPPVIAEFGSLILVSLYVYNSDFVIVYLSDGWTSVANLLWYHSDDLTVLNGELCSKCI